MSRRQPDASKSGNLHMRKLTCGLYNHCLRSGKQFAFFFSFFSLADAQASVFDDVRSDTSFLLHFFFFKHK